MEGGAYKKLCGYSNCLTKCGFMPNVALRLNICIFCVSRDSYLNTLPPKKNISEYIYANGKGGIYLQTTVETDVIL